MSQRSALTNPVGQAGTFVTGFRGKIADERFRDVTRSVYGNLPHVYQLVEHSNFAD